MHYCTNCEKGTSDFIFRQVQSEEFDQGESLLYIEVSCEYCQSFKFGFFTLESTDYYGKYI